MNVVSNTKFLSLVKNKYCGHVSARILNPLVCALLMASIASLLDICTNRTGVLVNLDKEIALFIASASALM